MHKLATLNLCLGLKNKKHLVKSLLEENKIDILCLQEVEIENGFDLKQLEITGYCLEMETNSIKSRSCIYIKNGIRYRRRLDLEVENKHLVVVDIQSVENKKTRIINIYRSFNPIGQSQRECFGDQLNVIKNAINVNTICLGDFNLDYKRKFDSQYAHSALFDLFEEKLGNEELVQLVDFETWSRCVGLDWRSSILDHIYVKEATLVSEIDQIKPCFGDHVMITTSIKGSTQVQSVWKRDWRFYTKENLCRELKKIDWQLEFDNVQDMWNNFELKVVKVVDKLVPISEFKCNTIKSKPNPIIKSKINLRNRLLKNLKRSPSNELKKRINNLNAEIRSHFFALKKKAVRRSIVPGNSKLLWQAVNTAKDIGSSTLPDNLTFGNVCVNGMDRAECFSKFFVSKVKDITDATIVDHNVYNGVRKITANNFMFMSESNVESCMKSIKQKNCEGYDRIPQRIIADGTEHLLMPLKKLFEQIYNQMAIPEQWRFSKVIPVHKKGSKHMIENYRPVSNLCGVSKVFERLILNRIGQLEILNKVDLTGKQQHGFKKAKGTCTAGLLLQSLIARGLDEGNYVAMASLDLSAAFDVVDVPLLIKRLTIMGLPDDLVELIRIWLTERYFYVEIDGVTSTTRVTWFGIIQGSILGPILYALFISPLFDIETLTCYADDKCGLEWDKDKEVLAVKIHQKLKRVTTWLTQSGLKVNEAKTDLCLFYYKDTAPITITIGNVLITSKKVINVLGVLFDQKLQWSNHISNCLLKANKALSALRLIRRFFTTNELLQFVTSNVFSILYYNSEIWHLPDLKQILKQKLLSFSANAIKMCMKFDCRRISFVNIHAMNKRATPEKYLIYKHALMLFKLYNSIDYSVEWSALNVNQILTTRQTLFISSKSNKKKVGLNAMANRLYILNGKIPLDWLNLTIDSYKVKCKNEFL